LKRDIQDIYMMLPIHDRKILTLKYHFDMTLPLR